MLDSAMFPFVPETVNEKFIARKFKADKDYRAAVVEATRLVLHSKISTAAGGLDNNSNNAFEADYMEQIKSCQQVR